MSFDEGLDVCKVSFSPACADVHPLEPLLCFCERLYSEKDFKVSNYTYMYNRELKTFHLEGSTYDLNIRSRILFLP